jgi:hypothetical protein
MGYCTEYRCDFCGAVQRVSTMTLRRYVLENGERLPCLARLGWCAECRSLVAMEYIRPLEDMVSYLARLETDGVNDQECQEGARLFKEDVSDHVARRIDHVRKAIEWRQRRESPSRCLECASTNVTAIGSDLEDASEFEHPGCGGIFRIVTINHFSEEDGGLFSREGRKPASG